jgi:hypothetical protein
LKSTQEKLLIVLNIEETFDLLLENYAEFERDFLDLREGSGGRTSFEPEERKKDRIWQLQAYSPRVFGHHEHLAVLM